MLRVWYLHSFFVDVSEPCRDKTQPTKQTCHILVLFLCPVFCYQCEASGLRVNEPPSCDANEAVFKSHLLMHTFLQNAKQSSCPPHSHTYTHTNTLTSSSRPLFLFEQWLKSPHQCQTDVFVLQLKLLLRSSLINQLQQNQSPSPVINQIYDYSTSLYKKSYSRLNIIFPCMDFFLCVIKLSTEWDWCVCTFEQTNNEQTIMCQPVSHECSTLSVCLLE